MSQDPFEGVAAGRLREIEQALVSADLRYIQLPESPFGVGLSVSYGNDRYSIISINYGEAPYNAFVSSGVLRDVHQDRAVLLDACNTATRNNPAFPVFLHDAENGWDVIASSGFPIHLLARNPGFLREYLNAQACELVAQQREVLQGLGVGGVPYTAEDFPRLLIRSLL